METRFQTTSFIPRSSLDNVVDDKGHIQKKSGSVFSGGSIFTLISFFIFICSLVAAGVVFSLDKLSVSNKASAEKALAKYQERSNAQTIEDLKATNDRLEILKGLLEKHVAIRPLFAEIGRNTLDRVSLTGFSLKRKPDGTFALALKAQGVGYESIVVQDKQFSEVTAQKTFKNTSISDFSKARGQDIAVFNINTTVVESAVNFSSLIRAVPVVDQKTINTTNSKQ